MKTREDARDAMDQQDMGGVGDTEDTGSSKPGGVAAVASVAFGGICYLAFLGAFLYAIGFVSDLVAPRTLDTGPVVTPWLAALVDVALISLFAAQHSVMARAGFKRRWRRAVSPALERSVYVLVASLLLFLLFWGWLPLTGTVWDIANPIGRDAALALAGVGWLVVLLSSFLIDHAELTGLRQVWARWQGATYTGAAFETPGLYRLARHPMMTGFLLAFWATPRMTVGHLLFALAMTGYILLGVTLEERDLLARFGATYRSYQRRVRMFAPFPR